MSDDNASEPKPVRLAVYTGGKHTAEIALSSDGKGIVSDLLIFRGIGTTLEHRPYIGEKELRELCELRISPSTTEPPPEKGQKPTAHVISFPRK